MNLSFFFFQAKALFRIRIFQLLLFFFNRIPLLSSSFPFLSIFSRLLMVNNIFLFFFFGEHCYEKCWCFVHDLLKKISFFFFLLNLYFFFFEFLSFKFLLFFYYFVCSWTFFFVKKIFEKIIHIWIVSFFLWFLNFFFVISPGRLVGY